MTHEKIDYINKIDFFSTLTSKELEKVSEKINLKTYKKNEIIMFEEDTNEFMYMIIYGKVKVFQTSRDGKESILAMHHTGEFFGEMSLLDGSTAPATVVTKEKSLVGIISRADFYSLLYDQKKIFNKLLQILCTRLRESWKKNQILNIKNAYQRIKLLFVSLSDDHGKKTEDGITLQIKLTHQDIADMSGLTRESVTRVIDKWKREKTVTILKNKYIHLSKDFFKNDLDDLV
jgi:CRP/FNR family transcriptional regulator